MRYVAAYLLSALGGNENPSLQDIKKILGSVGIDCEEDNAKKVLDSLKGQNVEEILSKGREKLASVPSGGGVAVAAGGAPVADSGAAKKEDKKEEKKEESEEEDEDMGFGLFD